MHTSQLDKFVQSNLCSSGISIALGRFNQTRMWYAQIFFPADARMFISEHFQDNIY